MLAHIITSKTAECLENRGLFFEEGAVMEDTAHQIYWQTIPKQGW